MIATVKCDRCGKEFNVPETENIMIMLKGEDNILYKGIAAISKLLYKKCDKSKQKTNPK